MDKKEIQNALVGGKSRWQKNLLTGLGIFLVLGLVAFGVAWAYSTNYNGRIFPGVYIGKFSVGNMTKQEAKDFIENFNNRITKEGLSFYLNKNGDSQHVKFSVAPSDDSSVEMIKLNSDRTVDKLFSFGRSGNFWQNLWEPLYYRIVASRGGMADLTVDGRLADNLEKYVLELRDPPHNANIKITSLSPLEYIIEPEKNGNVLDIEKLKNDIQVRLASMSLEPVEIYKKDFKPDVLEADLAPLISKLPDILNYGNLGLNYIDPQTRVRRDWSISPNAYSDWLEVRQEKGEPVLALNKEKVEAYLETLRPFVDMPAQNAKFVMEGEKVKEFQGSQTGIQLDAEKTYNDLDVIFRDRNYRPTEPAQTVTLSVVIIKPAVEMSDVNNLGIMEVLGVGFSTFKDSHTNRIKNIANAVKRLNGILIKPGEEFSANKYAGPYTRENGFLPEMVIKGSQIIPEVGGGMCQIGTTLFRMAMNAGMPITERRNHSLVVGYYADPVNGNPGTDATLYEPNVDFKFLNDTGGYLLVQTEIDYKNQRLVFTLWGKSDGRKGSYSHPVVSKWIPAGEPQEIVSPDLKPGEKTCQNAFRGAVANFVYTRFTSSSEKIERVFDSYYRPLPKICMVGVTSTPAGEVLP